MKISELIDDRQAAEVLNAEAASPVVLVCEHASRHIPEEFNNLGLADSNLASHAAWDPGALAVARGLSDKLDATLVSARISRLVYDCNRPPSAPDAMPHQSETITVPGNAVLTPSQRQDRADRYYEPFRSALSDVVGAKAAPVIVTIHSFTPVYHGKPRVVEIGVLHDASDTRLADAMLANAHEHTSMNVMRNQPYGPEHGVIHTLQVHALPAGHLNVMLEIRNDLIVTAAQQDEMAKCIAVWVTDTLAILAKNGIHYV